MKNIVICLDGTWNDPTERTNVYKLFQALQAGEEQPIPGTSLQGPCIRRSAPGLDAYYIEGVGADGRHHEVLEGALGVGLHQRVLHAYLFASRSYQPGDKLWIFGFSRGAWAARSLAGFIARSGLLGDEELHAENPLHQADLLWRASKSSHPERRGESYWAARDAVPIKLVGVWDTVGALGIPFFNGIHAFDILEKHLFDFADLVLSPRVEQGRHAMAVDETREDFSPTPWKLRADNSIRQVWFAGVHADVGGGYAETGLSDIALQWMIEEAVALPGAPALDISQLDLSPKATQDRHDEANNPVWKLRPRKPRSIATDAPLHDSVYQRFHARADYRPKSLSKHAELMALYAGPHPAEQIIDGGEQPPARHLAVGELDSCDVFAQNCWNTSMLEVCAGERYRIAAEGQWWDSDNKAGAEGYPSPNTLLRVTEGLRRVKGAQWFSLIAAVHPSADLESHNPSAGNLLGGMVESLTKRIGKFDGESQLVDVGRPGSELVVDRDGYLYFFANDVSGAYANNMGYLRLSISRLG